MQQKKKGYIYAVAAYTFYKLTMAVIHVKRSNRAQSPVLMTIRSIGHADALVSLLSLQTALFVAFPPDNPELQMVMNLCTGIAVCLMTLGMGVGMSMVGFKKIKKRDD